MSKKLEAISDILQKGGDPSPMTTRELLWIFKAQRRSPNNVANIASGLKKFGLETNPDWKSSYIDADLTFHLSNNNKKAQNTPVVDPTEAFDDPVRDDPTFRISKLAAANQGVISASPNDTIEQVITIMMERNFSQVPVMTNERDVKGMISWRSIGTKLALIDRKKYAKDYMEPAYEVRDSDSMFDLISMIVQRDFVLVRNFENKISGIITGSDLSVQFQQISEPFLLLSEIENLLRLLITDKFDLSDLQSSQNRDVSEKKALSVADLTFGEYIRLLENPSSWSKFNIAVDRVVFCRGLDDVRKIRNDVMHFDPDGPEPKDLERLRGYTKFLRGLYKLMY